MKILGCFCFWGLTSTFALCQSYANSGELLWEIDNGKNKSYVWGTLHSNDKELFEFPDSVYWAFSRCRRLALEIDVFDYFLERDPMLEKRPTLFDKRGKIYTSSDEPSPTFYGSEDGMPQFMDAFFQEEAERAGKALVPLETVGLQTKAFDGVPLVDQASFGSPSERTMLKTFYLQGEISAIDQIIRARFSQEKQAYLSLIEKRNFQILEVLLKEIKVTTVFCAIGAAHLYGEKGIIQLLRLRGCKVRRMDLRRSGAKDVKGFPTNRQYELLDSLEGSVFKATFPGVPRAISSGWVFKELGQGNVYKIQWQARDTALSLLECAELFMASPPNCSYILGMLDDGTEYVQGLSDVYLERLAWKRILINARNVVILSCQGGNKFMNSDRPSRFFNSVVLE